ncbi:MAG: hypothetical protein O6913_02320 [Chloroflexi bacterium]|nr:hypothetical protein [Chloroflexota bacterium]
MVSDDPAAAPPQPTDDRPSTVDPLLQSPAASFYATLATAILIGIVGLILLPATVAVWNGVRFVDSSGGALELFGLAITIATMGIILADAAFARFVWRAGLQTFCFVTQVVILGTWIFAFAAAVVAI